MLQYLLYYRVLLPALGPYGISPLLDDSAFAATPATPDSRYSDLLNTSTTSKIV